MDSQLWDIFISNIQRKIWYCSPHNVGSNCFLFQALYFCVPFRDQLLEYYANNKNTGDVEENMLTCLADLFSQVLLQLLVVIVIPVLNFLDILQHVGRITNKTF